MTNAYRLLALGNSYTIGTAVPLQDSWPEQLYSALQEAGYKTQYPTVLAKNGWTSADLLEALSGENLQSPYHLGCLQIGVNDQYDGVPATIYARNLHLVLDHMLGLTKGDPRRILVLSIPDWSVTPFARDRDRDLIKTEIEHYNDIKASIAAAYGTHHVNITPLSRQAAGDRSLLAEDELHPSGKMYKSWVAHLLPTARKILETAEIGRTR